MKKVANGRFVSAFEVLLLVCIAVILSVVPSDIGVRRASAQSTLDIRGAMSLKIVKGKVSFKIGEVANLGTSTAPSGQLELSVWLSRKPFDEAQGLRGSRIAKCSFNGIIGGETMVDVSCQAKLRPISRGKYYIILALSELDLATGEFALRDQFTFSKRLKF